MDLLFTNHTLDILQQSNISNTQRRLIQLNTIYKINILIFSMISSLYLCLFDNFFYGCSLYMCTDNTLLFLLLLLSYEGLHHVTELQLGRHEQLV